MKVGNQDLFKKSSFESVDNDFAIIVKKILEDDKLKKLLFYNTKDCLSKPNLTEEETFSLIGKQVRIVPKVEFEDENLTYLILSFDNFSPNMTNPHYRDNILIIDILCNFDQWDLGDFKLRPYQIASRLDVKLNEQHLTGIGTLQFLGMSELPINDNISGLSLMYSAVHGKEDSNAEIR